MEYEVSPDPLLSGNKTTVTMTMLLGWFVLGLCHHPVFDHLQHAKEGGERPGRSRHMNDINVYLGEVWGGVPD